MHGNSIKVVYTQSKIDGPVGQYKFPIGKQTRLKPASFDYLYQSAFSTSVLIPSFSSAFSNVHSMTMMSQKPTRVLSCVLCQQRKVKCERKFPCAYCVKCGVQCVPASKSQRRRRRRFPERELLNQLKKYEDLLRENSIAFESLHDDTVEAMESLDVGDIAKDAHSAIASSATTVDSKNSCSAR